MAVRNGIAGVSTEDPKAKNESTSNTIRILVSVLTIAVLLATAFMIALIVVLADQNKGKDNGRMPTWPPPTTSPLGTFSRAAVAADNGKCAEFGRDVMTKGGNAVDAIVAVTFCIGVMDAQSAGIGGGHFLTIYNKTSKSCHIIDARETAPASAYRDMYVNESDSKAPRGWASIAIPGEVYGLRRAYELYGSGLVPWRDLLQPTIDLCRNGFVISGSLGGALGEKANDLLNEPTMKDVFYNSEAGRIYKSGEIMKRPVLADTLEQLANSADPINLFYEGDVAKKFIQDFVDNGITNITAADFANYTIKHGPNERPAIAAKLKGSDLVICGPPPPSSAAVTISILNILAQYSITPEYLNNSVDNNVETYHRFIEAMKYAYAAREHLGDMDFEPSSVDLARTFVSDDFAREVQSRIAETAHQNASDYYFLNDETGGVVSDHGTSHISVLDAEGNAASLTTTINLFFGSMKRSVSTDIIWNDDMQDFSTPGEENIFGYLPSPYNYIEPGKRPLSSMTPVVIYDDTTGDVKAVSGGAGGARIISATANVLMRLLWFGQNVKEAVDNPRLHNQLHPLQTEYENGFPQLYLDRLLAKGQEFVPYSDDSASCGTIVKDNGNIYANSDYRKAGGYPAGF